MSIKCITIKMIMIMNTTNNYTLSDFGTAIAIVANYFATNFNPIEIMSFSPEFMRISTIEKVKEMDLIEKEEFHIFRKLFLDLSDYRIKSYKHAMMEYSSVLH